MKDILLQLKEPFWYRKLILQTKNLDFYTSSMLKLRGAKWCYITILMRYCFNYVTNYRKKKMEKVKFEAVSYSYGEDNLPAVDSLDFKIEEGEFVTILGHNGSGKSTTAKLINALLIPEKGSVYVDGFLSSNHDSIMDIRAKCGMVFQNPDNLIVAGIVEDDVAFGPENLGVDPAEIRERVDDSLKRVGMYEFIHRAPHQLSGGQKQRVGIAGVLAMKPSCIVFDEPTAMLDPIGRRDIVNTILDLHQTGITIILITHHTEDALLSDRVMVMKQGKVVLNDKPEEVFKDKELIESLALDMPESIRIVEALKKRGIEIDAKSYSYDELVESICRYVQKN